MIMDNWLGGQFFNVLDFILSNSLYYAVSARRIDSSDTSHLRSTFIWVY